MRWFIVIPGVWEEGTISLRRLKDAISGVRLVLAWSAAKAAERFYDQALVIPVRVFPAERDPA